ncbi:NADP-dependent isocitrate dehydrogenase [Campylobacter sp. 7477a]|uniref:NADP-dependent isocitrate dehydrogenase n=1 Tax=Campylobacter sp. 7477a TaxID=2735741 RepID=UPI003014A1B9|nr:NADP-dependent isocitrate dehydrogenase [Campylobacter sp. 7477a]
MSEIIWTKTDEAPLFSSYSLLPILQSFLSKAGIKISQKDISLAGRILAEFSDILANKHENALELLGELTKSADANIIKLPNISATLPQLNAAISELRSKGFDLPLYPNEIKTKEDEEIAKKYAKIIGSAVNPVLRQGNSDRRCVKAVKDYARANPHSTGEWDKNVKTRVAHMQDGDFYANEESVISKKDDVYTINFINKNGEKTKLKELEILKDEIIDASFMSVKKLDKFYQDAFKSAKDDDLLVSLHLKATMMKVSDPAIFGHAIKIFFNKAFDEFGEIFKSLEINENNGLKDIFAKISTLKETDQNRIKAKFDEIFTSSASVAMVNSAQGVTNFHVPNDTIIDASMPAMIRNSGTMYDKNGEPKETLAIIPDKTYATLYQACINNLKEKGSLDVTKIGSVSNVGLMAKKAEEYGSHDKTFIAKDDGEFIVVDKDDKEVFKFNVQSGDIFRMTQAKDDAIKSWIDLALNRGKITGEPLVFWLDENRAHDRNLKSKIDLLKFENAGVKYEILNYEKACEKCLDIIREGKNVIGVTGNVLRDYLTDLFPILELGTSSKMLSVVPLLCGGGMFETGAGGTAPVLVKELIEQNHLIWDSLGEYLALIASLEHLANSKGNKNAKILAKTLDGAVNLYLKNNKSPQMGVKNPDTRASHYYLALYWAQELKNSELGKEFTNLADDLLANEAKILNELCEIQGDGVDFGGYFYPDEQKSSNIMRPSQTLNKIIG